MGLTPQRSDPFREQNGLAVQVLHGLAGKVALSITIERKTDNRGQAALFELCHHWKRGVRKAPPVFLDTD